MNVLLPIREFVIKNFFISIKSLEINKTIIKNNIFFYLLRLIPFFILKILFNCFNFKYIYLMDDLYFSNHSEVKITPVLIGLKSYELSLMEKIKKYSFSIPIWFFLENENLTHLDLINVKFINKGKLISKDIVLNKNDERLLSDIFS